MPRKPTPLVDRFWKYAKKNESGCWIWSGATTEGGYAQLVDKGNGKPKIIWGAHRLAYTLFVGPIPEGLLVLHKCDVPACVNPDHLFLGTALDNMRDRKAKGHYDLGSANSASKLTESQVAEIRRLYSSTRISTAVLATQFGVTRETIWTIAKRRSWKHVP